MNKKIIAIDGPAGAGKSTVARKVAEKLNYLYIDSGAMYRAVTYKAIKLSLCLSDQDALSDLASHTDIKLANQNGNIVVYCDGIEVTREIREPEVSEKVSLVSLVPGVREKMVELQRKMAEAGEVVMDGRDICTKVLPDADCKIFLTASLEERTKRRYQELAGKGYDVSFEEIRSDLLERDTRDMTRPISPLVQAPDARLIDSTRFTIEEMVDQILEYCKGDI